MWAGGSLRMCVSGCTPGTGTNYADNVWHFAAVTVMDDGAVRMYNDGADTPYLSQPTVTGSIGGDIWLGRDVYSGNFYYGGSLDDVRVYSRSLSVAEIKAIYQRGAL